VTQRAESADTLVHHGLVSPTNDRSRLSPATTTVSRHSDSAVEQRKAAASERRQTDAAVKRRQIGQKRKSLQEMRHLLYAAKITVITSASSKTVRTIESA